MRKFMLYYLLLALPGILVALFFQNRSTVSVILQWICAAVMVLGWSVLTGFSAYRNGRRALGLLLLYASFVILDLAMVYTMAGQSRALHAIFNTLSLLTFRPLDILVVQLLDYNFPQEIAVMGFLIACCLVGFLVGILCRGRRKRHIFAP